MPIYMEKRHYEELLAWAKGFDSALEAQTAPGGGGVLLYTPYVPLQVSYLPCSSEPSGDD